jgi:hypothetical protein
MASLAGSQHLPAARNGSALLAALNGGGVRLLAGLPLEARPSSVGTTAGRSITVLYCSIAAAPHSTAVAAMASLSEAEYREEAGGSILEEAGGRREALGCHSTASRRA